MCALLRYYAASCGNCLPTFRDIVSVPSLRVKNLQIKTLYVIRMRSPLYHGTMDLLYITVSIFIVSVNGLMMALYWVETDCQVKTSIIQLVDVTDELIKYKLECDWQNNKYTLDISSVVLPIIDIGLLNTTAWCYLTNPHYSTYLAPADASLK